MNEKEQIISIFSRVLENSCLKKAVFSKSCDKNIVRTVARVFAKKDGESFVQLETFTSDNKALHKNLSISEAPEYLANLSLSQYMQTNIVGAKGECEIKISKKGKIFISDKIVYSDKAEVSSHNREKSYILDRAPFLELLGVCNQSGKIIDKKQSKFRQINRFLEHIEDIYERLPKEGVIRIYDLCCGKSYLSFALYHYFAITKSRKVSMTGVDLKADVVEYCNRVSQSLGFSGLEFICGDAIKYETDTPPVLVVSLHACDIATDIVLHRAADWEAKVILSTPCCHHELANKLDCPSLGFVSEYPMLKRKMCDALTDAARLAFLKSRGYAVSAAELVDPDDTPKNILLRAVRKKNFDPTGEQAKKALQEYEEIKRFLIGEEKFFSESLE